ncbi:MAG: lasso RiPP family leader peptide-containing protein [Thermoleophilaceae bacterium]
MHESNSVYEPPQLTLIGTVHELTQGCDKRLGQSDGNTFIGQAIVCNAS